MRAKLVSQITARYLIILSRALCYAGTIVYTGQAFKKRVYIHMPRFFATF